MFKQLWFSGALLLCAPTAMAEQSNWYLGMQMGFAQTDVSANDFNAAISDVGINVATTDVDKEDVAAEIFGGYRFNPYVALELGYIDLGDRSVSLEGEVGVNQLNDFLSSVATIYPVSGDGITASVNFSWPINDQFSLDARIGMIDWSGKFSSYNGQALSGSAESDGSDPWYGLRANYHFDKHWRFFAAYSEYQLAEQDNTMWSAGASYGF